MNGLVAHLMLGLLVTLTATIVFYIIGRQERKLSYARYWFLSFGFLMLALAALMMRSLPYAFDAALLTAVASSTAIIGFVLQYMGVRRWLDPRYHQPWLLHAAAATPLAYAAMFALLGDRYQVGAALARGVAIGFPLLSASFLFLARTPKNFGHYFSGLFLLIHPAMLSASVGGQVPTELLLAGHQDPLSGFYFGMPISLMGAAAFFLLGTTVELTQSLHGESIRDPLTTLLNRKGIMELGQPLMERAKTDHAPLSIVVIDLDDFKSINDAHGHGVGDKVLHGIAREISRSVRRSDLCCRWGGEEFVLVLPRCDENQAALVAEKLRTQIRQSRFDGGGRSEIGVTASFAVADFLLTDINLDGLIHRADSALYHSKSHGKNCVTRASGLYPEDVPPAAAGSGAGFVS